MARAWGGRTTLRVSALLAAASLAACAGAPSPGTPTSLVGGPWGSVHLGGRLEPRAYNRPYTVRGRRYEPADQPGYVETGLAGWYGLESGRRTSDGEAFTLHELTAAHRTLPIPSLLEVTNLDNGRRVVVWMNDRGPFVPGRLVDLSRAAAGELGFLGRGVARVRVRYLGPADGRPSFLVARTEPPRAAAAHPPTPPPARDRTQDAPGALAQGPGALVADLPD